MDKLSIRLNKPARKWDDGLPLGNGRLGAMVLGRVGEESVIINEETLCYGPYRNRANPDAKKHIDEIRKLLVDGDVEKAAFLGRMALTSVPKYNNPYQPVGDLRIYFQGGHGKAEAYERCLDIENAVAHVSYSQNDTNYVREYFVSEAYQVLAIHIKALGKNKINLCVNIGRKPFEEHTGVLGERTAGCWGVNGQDGMHYLSAVRISSKHARTMGDFVYVEDETEVSIFLAAQTDYLECLKGKQEKEQLAYKELFQQVENRLIEAERTGYKNIKETHIHDYHELYNNFDFFLGDDRTDKECCFTDQLLQRFREDKCNSSEYAYLIRLLLQYSRYLMISSSNNCLLPANLQGIWNGSFEPPWQSQYTININTQMNYWFVEKAGLSRCHLPLFNLIKLLEKNGSITARELYGCRGSCAHHNTNVWGTADPEGSFDSSPYWVMGNAWLCLHLFEHYQYTKDLNFLKETAMPAMRESIRFFEDYLYKKEDGSLVTGPVISPENSYISEKGESGALSMGTAMDNSILHQLIGSYLEGMDILNIDNYEDREILTYLFNKIPELEIGNDGRILEWMKEYQESEPGHRHISHLYGLHPGHEIIPESAELFKAAKKTFAYRLAHGGGHTGWSRAWLCCFASRLGEGEELYKHLGLFIKSCLQDNMLDVHPPFQIDGNFGITEAILEAVIQERNNKVYLLPALPSKWQNGEIRDYCLKGSAKLSMRWRNARITMLNLKSRQDGTFTICYRGSERKLSCTAGEMYKEIL